MSESWTHCCVLGASRTVLDALGSRFRFPLGDGPPGGPVRGGWAGSLTPSHAWSSLGGPMPRTITPVVWGRCRPTPDRVSESASPDRDTGDIVTGHLSVWSGQGFLPVLRTPQAGVGGVDRDNAQAVLGGRRHQPGLELPGRHAGVELPELLCAPSARSTLSSCGVRCLRRSRTATPQGPDTTNEAVSLRKPPTTSPPSRSDTRHPVNEQQPPRSPIRLQNSRSHPREPTGRTHSRSPLPTSAQ